MSKKLSQEEFVQKAKIIRPEYDYSKAVYINTDTPVILKCKVHGEFNIIPDRLLRLGCGCQKCSIEKNSEKQRIEPSKFIERAKEVFPEYDYSKTIYVNSDTKVLVICKKHGEFSVRPYNLLKHHGCKKCGIESNSERQKLSQEEFLQRAKAIHPEYDYSRVVYINSKTKVTLGCSIHGDFLITPSDILAGKGCKKCGFDRSAEKQKYTTEEFIAKAKENYPDYDYSKVVYKNAYDKITVICKEHGEFKISPCKLLSKSGYGCQKCGYQRGADKQRKTTEDFIKEAALIHPEFDYSKVEYISAFSNIKIICKKHGEFITTPDNLLNSKYGCMQCAFDATSDRCRFTQEEFIEKAQKIHPSLDFSSVNFTRTADKVTVICKIHGAFTRSANDILQGGGCPKCGIQKRVEIQTKSQEDFIREASEKFPDLDFSKAIYKTSGDKIIAICKKHGEFLITPDHLLGKSKHGCPYCANEATGQAMRFTTEEFIERARKIFPEYDYSKVAYETQETKVSIICKKHGEFKTRAGSILAGHGCPICKAPRGELRIRNWLMENGISFKTQKKFTLTGNLSYDFYIPSKHILIEYNGEQHYGVVPYFHRNGLIDLRIQFENDMIKKKYAKEHNYKLIVIPYWDLENIDKILSVSIL